MPLLEKCVVGVVYALISFGFLMYLMKRRNWPGDSVTFVAAIGWFFTLGVMLCCIIKDWLWKRRR